MNLTKSFKWPLVAVCGKFQPFHNEHLTYVLAAFKVGEHVIIGITNPDPTYIREEDADPIRSTIEANPFTYYERHLMVVECLRDEEIDQIRYDVVPFPINVPESWFYYIPKQAIFLLTLYDEDKWLLRRKKILELHGIHTEVLWTKQKKGITGTEIRRRIRLGTNWEELVPLATRRIIKRHGLENRIRK